MSRAKKKLSIVSVCFMFYLGINVHRTENAPIPAKSPKRSLTETNESQATASRDTLQGQAYNRVFANHALAEYLKGYWIEIDINKHVMSFYHFTDKKIGTLLEESSKTYRASYSLGSENISVFQLATKSLKDDKFIEIQYEYCAGEGRHLEYNELLAMQTRLHYDIFKFNVEAPLKGTPWFYIGRQGNICLWSMEGDDRFTARRMERLSRDEYELWKKIMDNWNSDYLLHNMRKYAAQALGEMKDQQAVESLIAALNDDDSYVRLFAAEALGKIKDTRAARPLFETFKNEKVVFFYLKGVLTGPSMALWALKEMEDSIPLELLIEGTETRIRHVQEFSAIALMKRKDPRIISPLFNVLCKPVQFNYSLEQEIEKALKAMEASIPIELLIAGLKNNLARRFSQASLLSLGPLAVESLSDHTRDQDPYLRRVACSILGKIKDTRAIEPLIIALNDKDSDVQAIAAEALGDIGDVRAVEPLIAILSTPGIDLKVKRGIANSLKRITKEDFGHDHKEWQKWWKKNKKKLLEEKK
jgi:HEAT repeat protein